MIVNHETDLPPAKFKPDVKLSFLQFEIYVTFELQNV